MTDSEPDTNETPERDGHTIHADIRIIRRIGTMPPAAMRLWQGLKAVLFAGAVVGALAALVLPDAAESMGEGLRWATAAVLAWLIWDRVVATNSYGISHVLVTSKGVCFTDRNLYVRWEDIESWKNTGQLVRLKPAANAVPGTMFATPELDIPLTEQNREFILEMFRERVARWKPDAGT